MGSIGTTSRILVFCQICGLHLDPVDIDRDLKDLHPIHIDVEPFHPPYPQ